MAEKSHQPTAKKLRDARKRGEVVRSKELTSLALYVASLLFVWLGAAWLGRRFDAIVEHAVRSPQVVATVGDWPWFLQAQAIVWAAATIVLPLLALGLGVALLVGGLQTRGVFSVEPLAIRFDRISLGKGLQNLFSSRQLFEVAKVLVKAVLLMGLLVASLVASFDSVVKLVYAPAGDLLRVAGSIVLGLMGWAGVVYAVGAALDYAHQRHEFMKQQKMTTDEIRRESRELEGDPYIKASRRATAREIVMSDMVRRTAEASVVLVNPTHVSVALYYAPGRTDLPRVVAKGIDGVALRIRREAELHGVPIFEDVPLARRVFREVALDHYINEGLIDAIAAVFRRARAVDRRPPGAP